MTIHSDSSNPQPTSEAKHNLLKALLRKKGINFKSQTIPQRSDSNSIPLSFSQERLWFLTKLEEGNVAYNMLGAVRINGSLQFDVLQIVIAEIVKRHEILRTNFQSNQGIPRQIIHSEWQSYLKVEDWQELPRTQQQTKVQQYIQQEAQTSFNLSTDPLLRLAILQLSSQEFILVVNMHHIISDGWSIQIFIKELSNLYQAFSQNLSSPLTDLPIQYADFAIWQREELEKQSLQTQLSYWQQQLANAPTLLSLPTDRPRPAIQTYRGQTQRFSLSIELGRQLEKLSRESETTLFMTLLAAFTTLLYRYSSQDDILIGSPVANRNHPEIESLIGFFVNILVLRTRFENDLSFRELLVRVKEITLEAYANQDVPFEQVVEALKPERSLSYSPLFQVMFHLQNIPKEPLKIPNLEFSNFVTETLTTKFDLSLLLEKTEEGFLGNWEYSTDLFNEATIARMAGHFQILLEAITINPDQLISELPLLTQQERNQLLVEWNNTFVEYPQDKCIHQLFEQQVERSPDAVAVVFEGEQLTYRELNSRANQLANYLRSAKLSRSESLGVSLEVLVGICVERSLDAIVGILGILKAGGAYIPIDPAYPSARIAYMLDNSQLPVLLTQKQLVASLPEHQARVIYLDYDWEEIAKESELSPIANVTPENLAYVIYTSGSTGKPKGAMNTHQGICNRLLWMQEAYHLTASDRIVQKTPFSFDVSVWEFFWPLIVGACLVIAQPGGHQDSHYLVNLIAQQKITTVHFVPAMLQVFLEEKNLELCSCLKRVICSGEALPFHLQERFFERLDCDLHNLYGPTEAAIDVTYWQCQPKSNMRIVPIGRPIANTQIYILDSHLQPVPIGVLGELYIGGIGVAQGYLNRPDLTEEKFIPNPFNNQPNSRLYKTGDLARYLPDGNIEYVARLDNQVKIRGFRIELGEIESFISKHPSVKETVVIAIANNLGNKQLVVYIVPRTEVAPSINSLRNFLKQKLPSYMIPATFIMLETLPLTPNGKIDKKALPKLETAYQQLTTTFVPPQTSNQKILANIWAEVLQFKQVGIHDNFFELGGDSILSLQIIARCHQANLHLTPKDLFQHQTIAELAQIATTTTEIKAEQGLITGILPLTPILHWFTSQNLPESHHFNQSFLFEISPDLKPELLQKVLKQLLLHHDALRLRLISNGNTWQLINASTEESEIFSTIDLSQIAPTEQITVIEATAGACHLLRRKMRMSVKTIRRGNDNDNDTRRKAGT